MVRVLNKKYVMDFQIASSLAILELITHKRSYICMFFTLLSNNNSDEGV